MLNLSPLATFGLYGQSIHRYDSKEGASTQTEQKEVDKKADMQGMWRTRYPDYMMIDEDPEQSRQQLPQAQVSTPSDVISL